MCTQGNWSRLAKPILEPVILALLSTCSKFLRLRRASRMSTVLLLSLPVPPPSPLPPSSPQQQPSPQQPHPLNMELRRPLPSSPPSPCPCRSLLSPSPLSPSSLAARHQHLPSSLFSFHPMRGNHLFCGRRVRVSGCRRLGGPFRNAWQVCDTHVRARQCPALERWTWRGLEHMQCTLDFAF